MSSKFPAGILSYGACVPARRMSRASIADAHSWAFPALKAISRGEKSLCDWDEDVITMAVEAGRDCMRGLNAAPIAALDLASTTAPYADLQNASIAGFALRLGERTSCTDLSGSTRAGLSAVNRALNGGGESPRLVIASEKRTAKPASAQEMLYGSAAGALLVGESPDPIARFLGSESLSAPFVDHFRSTQKRFDYHWEERWVRDEGIAKLAPQAIRTLLDRLSLQPARVAHFGLAGGAPGSGKLVAKALTIEADRVLPDLQAEVGDCGAAHPLLLLIGALECAKAGDIIVIASFAQGCEVSAFEMLQPPANSTRRGLAGSLARRIEETSYLKMLSLEGHVELDWGMRSETDSKTALTQLYRSADQVLGFVGGRCEQCSVVQFPRQTACVNCGAANSQTPFPLADEPAKVATYTADWLQYHPSPPLYMGLVQFEVGARVLMEMVDLVGGNIEVGAPLEMRFRIKERDRIRGLDRYFWKAAPR